MSGDRPVSADKRCPSCRGRMQRFFAVGVELDRCRSCRGVWLDAGELSEVLMRELSPRLVAGRSDRPCAFCSRPMRTAELPGGRTSRWRPASAAGASTWTRASLEHLTYGTEETAPAGRQRQPREAILLLLLRELRRALPAQRGEEWGGRAALHGLRPLRAAAPRRGRAAGEAGGRVVEPVVRPRVEGRNEQALPLHSCASTSMTRPWAIPNTDIAPGTPFEQLPENWYCPECGATKADFELDTGGFFFRRRRSR